MLECEDCLRAYQVRYGPDRTVRLVARLGQSLFAYEYDPYDAVGLVIDVVILGACLFWVFGKPKTP